uniref:Rab-like protein 3 n=1 Tax=Xenopsylla cheopis TaxID=163159 RepID=A0A6M2DCA0_XENCH
MAAINKVKVIVAGDSGVGKSSLTHLITQGEPLLSPGWTIGCSLEVKLHEYKEGTQDQSTFFIELWDIGGSISHKNTRDVFYQPTHGIILVHDLTNRKSEQNLQKWLAEILNKEANFGKSTSEEYDAEQFIGSNQIPTFVIGTKLDLAEEKHRSKLRSISSIAEQCGADEIHVNCHQSKSLAAGSTSAVKLSRFFDKVIERRYYGRDNINKKKMFAVTPIVDRSSGAYSPLTMEQGYHNPLTPKFYHMD